MISKRVLILVSLFSISSTPAVFAEGEGVFVYDEKGKRDPLSPLVSAEGAVLSYGGDFNVFDLTLEGVMLNPKDKNIAIINGRIFKTGDVIGDYRIDSISKDTVSIIKGTERFELKLKKEE
jgi:hypothetical protein